MKTSNLTPACALGLALLFTGSAFAVDSSTPSGPTGNTAAAPASATTPPPTDAAPAPAPEPAQATTTTNNGGSVNAAFQTARSAVSPDVQAKVVSLYGLGTPAAIDKWYVIFYDPSVASHGRAVLVTNNQVTKTYEAKGGTTYDSALAFDPSRIGNETPALQAAQNYAAQHAIAYDSVRVLLKQASTDRPFRWRIELMNGPKSRGYVMVNASDDTFATYIAPKSSHHTGSSGSGGSGGDSVEATAEGVANDVKNTALGIGGDLQEFFTGERTIDR